MGNVRSCLFALVCTMLFPLGAAAADVSISPLVIDEEAKPRDILKGEVMLTNLTNHTISVFPDVRDYAPDKGTQSIVGWVELSRGAIEIKAGGTHKVPYLIHVNYDAKPGNYHGMLWFGTGSFRSEAEKHPERSAEILLGIKVLDDAIERLQLATFVPEKGIFADERTTFSYALQNTGNRTVAPTGNLRIFDRRGREIAEVPLNAERKLIAPDSKQLLAAAWQANGMFGRYKAVLDLEYGGAQKTITDTTFFWVLPWGKTLSLFTGISVAIVMISIFFHARSQARRGVVQFEEVSEELVAEPRRAKEAAEDAYFEKLRSRREAREQAHEALRISSSPPQRTVRHVPTHLSVNGRSTQPQAPATKLSKRERPVEDGNIVRLSRN